MHAMLVQGGTKPELRDDMNRAVVDLLVPALEAEPGFRGAINLEDRVTGEGVMVTLWDTEEQARRTPTSDAYQRAIAEVFRVSTGQRAPMSFWHVNTARVGSNG